jgi:exoribonuclease II
MANHLLFEDDGELKTASFKSQADTASQVELPSGRRIKIKNTHILLQFDRPEPEALLTAAKAEATDTDPQFLWEVSGDGEFGFKDLAQSYHGNNATPTQQAAVALALHQHPMYFYKRGKGRYQRAPEAALQAALASLDRKAQAAAQIATWQAEWAKSRIPAELQPQIDSLLHAPDKNGNAWKSLAAAADELRITPLALIHQSGGIPDTHDYHFKAFLQQSFPKGTGFPNLTPPTAHEDLPLASAKAFSIDDVDTTEIDDAFSVSQNAQGQIVIGIHIAAPALGITLDHPLEAIARHRLSTVYMPGNKITMLPEPWVKAYSLDAGITAPCLSLYNTLNDQHEIIATETKVERIAIAANLRHQTTSEAFATDLASELSAPWQLELATLHKAAKALTIRRDRLNESQRQDWNFYIDHRDEAAPDFVSAQVRIEPRPRGSPLDSLVAEFMIWANSQWGAQLAQAGLPAFYRVQQTGKTKMSSHPAPHEGLGVAVYAWSTSPLRRYSDLANQRQIIAVAQGKPATYAKGDANLLGAIADFDATYAQYGGLQDKLEQYWCLRWMLQAQTEQLTATVIRENLVRFDRLPIVRRIDGMPNKGPGDNVSLRISEIDLLGNSFVASYQEPAAT